MSDKEQIEAAKAAYNNATPGEWKYCGCNRCQLVWGDGLLVHDEPDGDDGDVPTPRDSTGINNAILIAAAPALMRRVQELEDENESLTLQIKELGDENAELAYMFDSYYKTTHDATRRFQGRIAELEDWQARVLPWLRRQQDYLKNKSDDYPESSPSVNAKIDADELTALIAEAKE